MTYLINFLKRVVDVVLTRKKLRIASVITIILLASPMFSMVTNSSNFVGAACGFSDDVDDVWFNAVKTFVEIIDAYQDWSAVFVKDYPDVGPYLMTEEVYGGHDDLYADLVELFLLLAHGTILCYANDGCVTIVYFNESWVAPEQVKLGYKSPDGFGYNIWAFILSCGLLRDDSDDVVGVSAWSNTLAGTHMILGFANSAGIVNVDLPELAYRLTGTGGYPKQRVQDAFFSTFVKYDEIHKDNIARIIAEDSYVADNDLIDDFNRYVEVDNVKYIITCQIP